MRLNFKYFHALLLLPLLTFCGSTPTLQITLTGTTAFADANVRDIVFVFQSQASTTGGMLDQDNNGVADFFIYPTACGVARPAGCGFPAAPSTITVGDLPLDYGYGVRVQLRNSTGTILYEGLANFQNIKDAPAVTVDVN